MTRRDVARGRDIVARWCTLAEQRLEYLTELFETGRWRRFHTEREFLENIREAKAAVATWRDLLNREAALDNTTIDLAWLGRRRTGPLLLTPLPRDEGYRQPIVQLQPQPAAVAAPPRREVSADILVAPENNIAVADEAPSAPDVLVLDDVSFPALDLDAMKERYPLLRNAL
ncbi:TIGR03809 family protein [Bradyrhizobium sp. WSM 1738]|uniref:TIGR03809 family protein n=1 Tax=Bradyrhizobium hereditatis TaxID=2821405 RepID=UPI001CE3AF11|nr:TIGR03809 family protein [Bradyrhizobium hereditatis]MCA6117640.1 TIGR03809 family protein [Bradyrhizobium hereditatis]